MGEGWGWWWGVGVGVEREEKGDREQIPFHTNSSPGTQVRWVEWGGGGVESNNRNRCPPYPEVERADG